MTATSEECENTLEELEIRIHNSRNEYKSRNSGPGDTKAIRESFENTRGVSKESLVLSFNVSADTKLQKKPDEIHRHYLWTDYSASLTMSRAILKIYKRDGAKLSSTCAERYNLEKAAFPQDSHRS